jgi:hypothetical protein
MVTGFWGYISAGIAIAIALLIVGIALAVLKALFDGTISLKYLIAEPADPGAQAFAQRTHEDHPLPPETPKASMSRLQLLIFTFVIAGVYLVLCLESGTLVAIPENVILLLGVSGGTYAASKGIKAAGESKRRAAGPPVPEAPRMPPAPPVQAPTPPPPPPPPAPAPEMVG